MSRIGKKILSAFVETTDDKKEKDPNRDSAGAAAKAPYSTSTSGIAATTTTGSGTTHTITTGSGTTPTISTGSGTTATTTIVSGTIATVSGTATLVFGADTATSTPAGNPRFIEYFDKLFSETNIPGPDYYEFSKMIEAMQAIPDERSRFYAAFAGLQVQGLDKEKLLSTAGEYLRILSADAGNFQATVDSALQEKVQRRTMETEEKGERIRRLSQEIVELQSQITALQSEIRENKEKIEASSGGYAAECERRKARIEEDIEKIRHFIH